MAGYNPRNPRHHEEGYISDYGLVVRCPNTHNHEEDTYNHNRYGYHHLGASYNHLKSEAKRIAKKLYGAP